MSEPASSFPRHATTEAVIALFCEHGDSEYGGEAVTQREHALQAALFAERESASPALIAAALLHDVGHLLHVLPDDAPEQGIDDRHEILGRRWLVGRFGPEVTEPVAMHVEAKRYLCATRSEYLAFLSPPSVLSLELQGGPMTPSEVRAFEASPFFRDAVRLREWDDAAKVVGLATPDVGHFATYVDQVCLPDGPGQSV